MTEQDRKEYISDLTEVRDNLKGISGGLFSGEETAIDEVYDACMSFLEGKKEAGEAVGDIDRAILNYESIMKIHRSPISKKSDFALYYRIAETMENLARDAMEEEIEK